MLNLRSKKVLAKINFLVALMIRKQRLLNKVKRLSILANVRLPWEVHLIVKTANLMIKSLIHRFNKLSHVKKKRLEVPIFQK